MLREAAQARVGNLEAAIDRLEEFDLESARLLRGLIANLDSYQLAGYSLNEDSIMTLSTAARQLETHFNEDNVGSFATAVRHLGELGVAAVADQLATAARELRRHGGEW